VSSDLPKVRPSQCFLIHLIATVGKLMLPGGARTTIAESLLLKDQLLHDATVRDY
jgi:hypothetical protein